MSDKAGGEGRTLASISNGTETHVYGVVDLSGPQEHVVVHRGGDLRTHGYAVRSLEVEEGGKSS